MTRLRDARVLVVGAGGIGCPALLALADAGVGHITVVDDDVVSTSNLHRQILFATADAGRPKVEAARDALARRAPAVEIRAVRARVTAANVLDHLVGHDVVLDGTDATGSKLLLNDACALRGVPLVHAGAVRWQGQVLAVVPGGACLRCAFPSLVADGAGLCGDYGVVGPVVGAVGALAAEAALAILQRSITPGLLVAYDGLAGRTSRLAIPRRDGCPACARAGAAVDTLDANDYESQVCL